MWVRYRREDARVVVHYLGMLTVGIAVAMLVPLLVAVAMREWGPFFDYLIGIGAAGFVGLLMMSAEPTPDPLNRRQAIMVTAAAWITATLAAAVPLAFSGNYGSYLDAAFDAMSGFATTGLTLAQNLDHMATSHQTWRHLLHLVGGQGIIVAALSFAVARGGGAFALYAAEGRDERIMPNVVHTARYIWLVTAVYVGLGTVVMFAVMFWLGLPALDAAFEAFYMVVAAFDTGGFAPHSQNALYYHSFAVEVVLMVLMFAGMVNFAVQADVWRGDPREMLTDIENRTLVVNLTLLTALAAIGVTLFGVLDSGSEVVRKAMFHIVSAHSGTGHQTIYPPQWQRTFGFTGVAAVILAMGAGGAVSSTSGGIKAFRIGVIVTSVITSLRQAIAPDSAVIRARYHHIGDRVLTPDVVSAAMTVFILYVVTYISGGLLGAAVGYPAGDALFESVSAAGGVGLSIGITTPQMPVFMKLLYMVQMWAGRLEFLALMAFVAAVIISIPRPRRRAR